MGGGVAGLNAALNLAPRNVCVITKNSLGENTSSGWAQGGIAAPFSKDDSNESHIQDTIATAKGLADLNVVKEIISESINIIKDLEGIGIEFDKNSDGTFNLGLEAAHSFNRIVKSKGDSSGIEIMRGLTEKVRKSGHITILENVSIDSIMMENNTIYGVIGHLNNENIPENHVVIQSPNVILATGGLGGIFANTTNPRTSYGEGIALAAEAGATITDMEFVQFHPTGLDFGVDPTPLATEAIRGEGATLVNQYNERFMLGIHPKAELASRDVIAQNIFKQIENGNSVFLDCRQNIGKDFGQRFPQVQSYCEKADIDPSSELIPIIPVAHYHIGGVKTDLKGRSSVEGLWCCGEVAATGLHLLTQQAPANISKNKKPNILFILNDQERAWPYIPSHVDLPARRYLENISTYFNRSYTSTPLCSPSRSSIYTGQHVQYTGVWDNTVAPWVPGLHDGINTIGHLLRNNDYLTSYFGKWHLTNITESQVNENSLGFEGMRKSFLCITINHHPSFICIETI